MRQDQLHAICKNFQGRPVEYAEIILGVTLTESQKQILTLLTQKPYKVLVRSANSMGKCFRIDTPIMTSNGDTKMVQDIRVGDYVMGADSKPKEVLSLTRGKDQLYEIRPNKGMSYVVNGDHVLCLKDKGTHGKKYKKGQTRTITVKDYLNSNRCFRHMTGGYCAKVSFRKKKLKLDPYWLGVWLGDGNQHNTGITTADQEIKHIVYAEASKRLLKVTVNVNKHKNCPTYIATRGRQQKTRNSLLDDLSFYGLIKNKHIPPAYLKNNRKNRLELLAGLIDTDGNVGSGNLFEFVNKNRNLIEDVIWLARSLGFASYLSKTIKRDQHGTEGTYFKCCISGKVHEIPCRIPRKKLNKQSGRDTSVNGITVTPVGEEDYYGFYIGGDGRFLLGDFTVVHNSYIAAVAALYAYDCFVPSITIVTAPTYKQVSDIIFKEIRNLSGGREGLRPQTPFLSDAPNHMIVGSTALNSTAFQGVHDTTVNVIVDEMVGVDQQFIEAVQPMLGGDSWFNLNLFNPTDQNSSAFFAEQSSKYHVVTLNALDHPNIVAELKGEAAPVPNAMRLDRLREMIELWCEEVDAGDRSELDFEFETKLWRPSPVAEARILGRWPSQAATAIWSDALFQLACNTVPNEAGTLQLACDPAAFGDDDTAIAVRKGNSLIHVESHNGWSPNRTIDRLKELSDQYKKKFGLPFNPPVVVDDTGLGLAISSQAGTYNFVGVNFGSMAWSPNLFPNKRSQMHFELADKAKQKQVSFANIPALQRDTLRAELMSANYKLDYVARRIVEKKVEIKKRLGRSPDLADAVMLAFCPVSADVFEVKPVEIQPKERKWRI